jgi:hypothetical protein
MRWWWFLTHGRLFSCFSSRTDFALCSSGILERNLNITAGPILFTRSEKHKLLLGHESNSTPLEVGDEALSTDQRCTRNQFRHTLAAIPDNAGSLSEIRESCPWVYSSIAAYQLHNSSSGSSSGLRKIMIIGVNIAKCVSGHSQHALGSAISILDHRTI